jgi:hypothetical protein
MNDIFADGIANVAVGNGVVRVDLVTQRFQAPDPQSKEGKPPRLEVTHHLVMPLPGFLNALALMEQVRAQLIKDGAIQVKPQPATVETKANKKS